MTAIWQDIDPNQAEASLRGLNRRLYELDEALQNQASLLRARPDSFAFRLANESLLHLQANLLQERAALLKHRVAKKIEIALDGGAFQNNTASIAALAALLMRLQKLYSGIAQAITQGPKLRGPIARDIMESATALWRYLESWVLVRSVTSAILLPSWLEVIQNCDWNGLTAQD